MKKYVLIPLVACLVFSMSACQNSTKENTSETSHSSRENLNTQSTTSEKNDGNYSNENTSKVISSNDEEGENKMTNKNNETKVTLTIGDNVIPATLNDTLTAKKLIEELPFTVETSKMQYDFCGTVEELPFDNSQRQAGWKNGDIGYSKGWFALFHNGEEKSSSHTSEMIIGHIDDAYLETIRDLDGSISITISADNSRL